MCVVLICGWRANAEYGGGSRIGVPSGLLSAEGRDAGGTAVRGSSTLGFEYCMLNADDRLSSCKTFDAIGGAPGEAVGLAMNRGGTCRVSWNSYADHAHHDRRCRGVLLRRVLVNLSRRKATQQRLEDESD